MGSAPGIILYSIVKMITAIDIILHSHRITLEMVTGTDIIKHSISLNLVSSTIIIQHSTALENGYCD